MALKSSREGLRKELVDYLGNIIIDDNLKHNIINSIDDVFINNEELTASVNELDEKIRNETSARENADSSLQSSINLETTARQESISNIENLINNGVLKVDLLWTSANISSEFVHQNISLDLSNYKMIVIILKFSTTLDANISFVGKKNSVVYCTIANPLIKYRSFSLSDNTTYISECYLSQSYTGETVDNSYLIPYQIYGVR